MEQKIKDEQNMESTKYKILIAPWGNPYGWKQVKYVYNDTEVTSKTPLKLLQQEINPKKLIIIGSITLAKLSSLDISNSYYDSILNYSETVIKNNTADNDIKHFKTIIAPGIGQFRNGTFKGNALDYYYFILYELIEEIINSIKESDMLEIHLDLTHGINYMTMLTYKAIKEIIGILSIFKDVKFYAYNADPFVSGFEEKLYINIIERTNGVPLPFNEKFSDAKLLKPIFLTVTERKKLFNKNNRLPSIMKNKPREWSAFIGAVNNGLPLAMFHFYPRISDMNQYIDNTLNFYNHEKYMKLKKEKNKIIFQRNIRFTNNFKVLLFLKLLVFLFKNNKLIDKAESEVNLKMIEKLFLKSNKDKNKKFELEPVKKEIITKEINDIKKAMKNKNDFNWLLSTFAKKGKFEVPKVEIEKELKGPIKTKRHFFAHAGLSDEAIEIKKEKEEIYLRYVKNKKKIESIAKLCAKNLISIDPVSISY